MSEQIISITINPDGVNKLNDTKKALTNAKRYPPKNMDTQKSAELNNCFLIAA